MALNNYSNLKAAIEKWSSRRDMAEFLDDIIDLAEAEMYKYLKIRDMQARATNTTDGRYLPLPDEYIEMRKLRIVSGWSSYRMQSEVPDAMVIKSGSGIPAHFTVTSQIEFDRTPDAEYTIEMEYWRKLDALDDTNTTNQVLTRFPDIYLFGSLWALYIKAREEELSEFFYGKFMNAIKQANDMDMKGGIGPTPRMHGRGPTP